jgi:hypothetical protein
MSHEQTLYKSEITLLYPSYIILEERKLVVNANNKIRALFLIHDSADNSFILVKARMASSSFSPYFTFIIPTIVSIYYKQEDEKYTIQEQILNVLQNECHYLQSISLKENSKWKCFELKYEPVTISNYEIISTLMQCLHLKHDFNCLINLTDYLTINH